jgi:hypothetical protein
MTMQSETTVTNHPDEAGILPTYCPWCLAVAAMVLTAVAVLIFFW